MTRTVNVDFSDVQGFEAIPEGRYSVVIDKLELADSKSSEHQMLVWTLKVAEPEEYKDRQLWMRTSFAPKALFRLKAVFETFGLQADSLVSIEVDEGSNAVLSPPLVGLPAVAVVSSSEYQGKMRNQVDDLIGEANVTVGAGDNYR